MCLEAYTEAFCTFGSSEPVGDCLLAKQKQLNKISS